jgi:RNA polymerase sigma-70 factor (ECF subfamily)
MSVTSDRDSLRLLRERDERGFDLAYECYAQRVFGFLVRLSRSRACAEDLLQHTFLRLAEHGHELRPDTDLRAWLFSVARNAFHSSARARAVAARFEASSSAEPMVAADATEAAVAIAELERALGSLRDEDRELLLLVGVEGLSYTETAAVLGVDEVAVRKRVSRARARLAEALDEPAAVLHTGERAHDRVR